MVRFKTGLSRLINKPSLVSHLILLVSQAKMSKWSKWSKLIKLSHCKRWSVIVDSSTPSIRFSVALEIAIVLKLQWKNVNRF